MTCSSLGSEETTSPAVVGDDHEVLDAHADGARDVDPGLDRDHHAGSERGLALLGQPRALVDVEPDAVAEAVAEVLGVAGGVDDRARHGVDLAAGRARAHGRQRGLLGVRARARRPGASRGSISPVA